MSLATDRKARRLRARRTRVMLLAAGFGAVPALGDVVVAEWVDPVSGSWLTPRLWSAQTAYPNNGNPAGTTYDVTIDAAGAAYTVSTNANTAGAAGVVVDSLTIDSMSATVSHNTGKLTLLDSFARDAGKLTTAANTTLTSPGTFMLNGGELRLAGTLLNTTVTGDGLFNLARGTLDGVTLRSALRSGAALESAAALRLLPPHLG